MAPTPLPAGTMAFRRQPTLHTGSLTLRPWLLDDAQVVLAAFADPEIRRWNRTHVETPVAAAAWISQQAELWAIEASACWAVCDAESGTVLGRAAMTRVELAKRQAAVAYWVLPGARGRGVAGGAVSAVTSWALSELGMRRMELAHSVHNPGSCRVALKAGYRLECLLPEEQEHDDGWHDMHLHATDA